MAARLSVKKSVSVKDEDSPTMATKTEPTDKNAACDSHSPAPLPLSRTCQNCAHAKIKCTRVNHPHICDR